MAAFEQLISTPEPPRLGPQGRSGTRSVAELDQRLAAFFTQHKVPPATQPALRSAALLWHDHLYASHTISQGLDNRDGSWLHGIMHRREPDYGNAKYWFRRVGQHDAFATLAERVTAFLDHDCSGLAKRLIENGHWMPYAFIDECERAEAEASNVLDRTLRAIQAIEFNVLASHLFSADR